MSVSIKFELPPGESTNLRQFPASTWMKVHGDVDYGGLPVANAQVHISIESEPDGMFSPLFYYTSSTFMGNYEYIFVTPSVDAKAVVTVTAYYFPASGGDRKSLNISFGEELPDPIPEPEKPWYESLSRNLFIGGAILLGAYLVIKAIPGGSLAVKAASTGAKKLIGSK